MKIAIGSDHGGYDLKEAFKSKLAERQLEVEDLGCYGKSSVDYPDFVGPVAKLVSSKSVEEGIVICTTGIGASITANKYPGVRAALCTTPKMAEMARRHNNANVLALGSSNLAIADAFPILEAWLEHGFDGGRHERRVNKIGIAGGILNTLDILEKADQSISELVRKEFRRREHSLNLIASENTSSSAVQAAEGSLLLDKYASGYPGGRHYPGCEHIDEIERLARDRVTTLFGAEYANVQCYSGSLANLAVFMSALKPGDTVLSMSPETGGHITHGGEQNISGKFYNTVHYRLDVETGLLDYRQIAHLAQKHKPKLICVGDSIYSRFIEFKKLREIADSAGAYLLADIAHSAGLVAAGCYPNPVPYCEFVTFTTHKTMRGPRGGIVLCQRRFGSEIDRNVFPGCQGGPSMNSIAAKAVCFYEVAQPAFKEYQQQVAINAKTLAEKMENGGLLVLSGGTDNHMMTVDVSKYSGNAVAVAGRLEKAGILLNSLEIKSRPDAPAIPCLRIGTADITTRGMRSSDMGAVYDLIQQALNHIKSEKQIGSIKAKVADLMQKFPLI